MTKTTGTLSEIDETIGRLSPTHLQMLWDSADFVGPGDVRDLVAEIRRVRGERDAAIRDRNAARAVSLQRYQECGNEGQRGR